MSRATIVTIVRILISLGLIVAMLFVTGATTHAEALGNTIEVTGNTDLVTFTAVNYSPTDNLTVTWGVSNLPSVTQTLTFTNRVASIQPPANAVSMLFSPASVTVLTTFKCLGSGWYGIPQAEHVLTITGNSDAVKFSTNWDRTTPINIGWGISGKPMASQSVTLTNRVASIQPPANTVSLLYWEPSVAVSTTFVSKGGGWYDVPQAKHHIVISGTTSLVTFTADYTPTVSMSVVWGVNYKPSVTEVLTFTNRIATSHPPTGTISLLFSPVGVTVSTTLLSLGNGWYELPSTPPIIFTNFVYLPNLMR